MTQAVASVLENIRVVDLSRAVAGPYCTMLLGDFGADVVKVEPPTGDMGRVAGLSRAGDQATYFLSMNRNKRSVVIDAQTEAGREVLARLIARADVLVENFRPGVLARLGFDEARLKALNPQLVLCSISGYGQDGPYAGRKSLDLIGQTIAGLASLTGEHDGPPTPAGAPMSDILTGLNACIAVLIGLLSRGNGGGFRAMDVSLLSSTLSALAVEATSYLNTGEVPGRYGSAWFQTFPYDVFPTADGHIAIGAAGDWQKLCELLGLDELGAREDVLDMEVRLEKRAELKAALSEGTRRFATQELVERLQAADLLCGPVYDLRQVFEDPAVQHAGLRLDLELPHGGTFGTVDSAAQGAPGGRSAGRFAKRRRRPPLLGEHTLEVMAELGYGDTEIEEACRSGAVAYLA